MQRALVGQATFGSNHQEIARELHNVKNNLGAGLLSLHMAATFVMTDGLRVVAHACAQGAALPHIIYDSLPDALPSVKSIHLRLLYSGPIDDAVSGIAQEVPLSHWQVITRLWENITDPGTRRVFSVIPAIPHAAMGIASDKQIEASITSRASVAKQQYCDIRQALGGTWEETHNFITHIDSGPAKPNSDVCFHGPDAMKRLALAHSRTLPVMAPPVPARLAAAGAVAPAPVAAAAAPAPRKAAPATVAPAASAAASPPAPEPALDSQEAPGDQTPATGLPPPWPPTA